MDVTLVTGMALEDWLLEGEAIRFSAYDFPSKTEIVVTDRRLIFYRSSLVKEILEVYNLAQIAGCRIEAMRRITLVVTGVILMIIGIVFSYAIYSEIIPIMPVIFGLILFITSSLIAMAGFTILLLVTSRPPMPANLRANHNRQKDHQTPKSIREAIKRTIQGHPSVTG